MDIVWCVQIEIQGERARQEWAGVRIQYGVCGEAGEVGRLGCGVRRGGRSRQVCAYNMVYADGGEGRDDRAGRREKSAGGVAVYSVVCTILF